MCHRSNPLDHVNCVVEGDNSNNRVTLRENAEYVLDSHII